MARQLADDLPAEYFPAFNSSKRAVAERALAVPAPAFALASLQSLDSLRQLTVSNQHLRRRRRRQRPSALRASWHSLRAAGTSRRPGPARPGRGAGAHSRARDLHTRTCLLILVALK